MNFTVDILWTEQAKAISVSCLKFIELLEDFSIYFLHFLNMISSFCVQVFF